MGTDIAVRDHAVPKGSALARSELELAEAMIDQFEAFYRQGCVLDRIKNNQEFKDAGYESFREYMDGRTPCGIRGRHADAIIAAKNLRPLLPDLQGLTANSERDAPSWSEFTIRPLTNKKFTNKDIRRIGKKIATQVKRGEPLTKRLVKSICDDELGVTRKKQEKKTRQLSATDTPAETLQRMEREVELWQMSLEKVPGDFWTDAEADDRGCARRLSKALSELASFLRS